MSAVAIVTAKLLASEEYTAIAGNQVYPIQAPQNAVRPYTVLHIIDNDDTPVLAGAGRYYRTIIQLDHYAEMTPAGAAQVLQLGDIAIEALNGVVKEKIAGCVDVDILLGSADFTESTLEANTHRRYTQFAVRWRRPLGGPADGEDPADPDDIGFTISAGTGNEAAGYVGANHFSGWSPFGSLDAEPVPDYALVACTSQASTGSVVAFSGDVSSLLAGKHLWVNGVDYGPGVQYTWTHVAGVTIWNRHTGGPVFASGQSYSVEIK